MRRTNDELWRQAIDEVLDSEYKFQGSLQVHILVKTRKKYSIPLKQAVIDEHLIGAEKPRPSLEVQVERRLQKLLVEQKEREEKIHVSYVKEITKGTSFEGITDDWEVWDKYPPTHAEIAEETAKWVELGFLSPESVGVLTGPGPAGGMGGGAKTVLWIQNPRAESEPQEQK